MYSYKGIRRSSTTPRADGVAVSGSHHYK